MTLNEAKNTTVFLVDAFATINSNPIKAVNLFKHIAGYAEQGTNPDGVGPKLFIREADESWELRYWIRGGKSRLIDSFSNEDEADEEWFQRTYKYDYLEANESNQYFDTYQEAEAEIIQLIAEQNEIDFQVAKSVWQKMQLIYTAKENRKAQQEAAAQAERERIQKLAAIYAAMIQPVSGETNDETAKRLRAALNGNQIEKKVFWKAVSIIRKS